MHYRLGERRKKGGRLRSLVVFVVLLTSTTVAIDHGQLISSSNPNTPGPDEAYNDQMITAPQPDNVLGDATGEAETGLKPSEPNQPSDKQIAVNLAGVQSGLYSGPGAVTRHNTFQGWLGKDVVYATDYIDYKSGWQYDFVDSDAWLTNKWGAWARQDPRRKLVLGLPMLQNENRGQFREVATGTHDQYFRRLGEELVTEGLDDTIIRLGYEANCNTIGPWEATSDPEGYKVLFQHIVNILKSVPGSRFKIDWTVCNGLQSGKPLNSFNSFYPGDAHVDIIGIDIYDVKWRDTAVTPQERWTYTLNRKMGVNELIKFARTHGKLLSIPEWGLYKPGDNFAGGGDNPYFIRKMAELMTVHKPHYQAYFDLDWGGGKLDDFPKGKSLYQQLFSK